MTFVRKLAISYTEQRLDERNDFTDWIFEDIRKEANRADGHSSTNDDTFLQRILDCLKIRSREFKQTYNPTIREFIEEIEREIYPLWNDRKNFYPKYQELADGLFSDPVGWGEIFVFLEFNAQLMNKIIESTSTSTKRSDKIKTSKMVSTIISYLCKYFDAHLPSWHLEKPESWIGFLEYERCEQQELLYWRYYLMTRSPISMLVATTLGLAASAAIIGGFYVCSKLSAQ